MKGLSTQFLANLKQSISRLSESFCIDSILRESSYDLFFRIILNADFWTLSKDFESSLVRLECQTAQFCSRICRCASRAWAFEVFFLLLWFSVRSGPISNALWPAYSAHSPLGSDFLQCALSFHACSRSAALSGIDAWYFFPVTAAARSYVLS